MALTEAELAAQRLNNNTRTIGTPATSGLVSPVYGTELIDGVETATTDVNGKANVTGYTTTAPKSTITTAGNQTATFNDAGELVVTAGDPVVTEVGGGNVDVYDTVYDNTAAILGNTNTIQESLQTGFANIPQTTVVSQNVDTSDLAKAVNLSTLQDDTTTGFANMDKGFSANRNALGNVNSDGSLTTAGSITDQLNTGFGGVGQALVGTTGTGGIKGQISNVDQDLAALGTADDVSGVNRRFNTLDTSVGNVQTGVNTANTNINSLSNTVDTGFADAVTQLSAMQSAVIGETDKLAATANEIKDNQSTQYGDLSSKQGSILSDVGQVQQGMDTLRTDTQKYQTLADQGRAELAKTVTGGFDMVKGGQLQAANNAASVISAVQNPAGANTNSGQYNAVAGQITNDGLPAVDQLSQVDFLNRLNTVKNILNTQGDSLDAETRSQYSQLANGFDQGGTLVASSQDRNGNAVRRGLDQQGQLITNTYSANGALATQSITDVNKLLSAIQPQQFGDLSQSGSGLMSSSSPYM